MSEAAPRDYKDTLNLPRTAFPMKGNLQELEPRLLAFWEEKGIYRKLLQANAAARRFVLHDGPPYANGRLHAGHALNKILKDIVAKHRNMSGQLCAFIPGWDCHGPIEQARRRGSPRRRWTSGRSRGAPGSLPLVRAGVRGHPARRVQGMGVLAVGRAVPRSSTTRPRSHELAACQEGLPTARRSPSTGAWLTAPPRRGRGRVREHRPVHLRGLRGGRPSAVSRQSSRVARWRSPSDHHPWTLPANLAIAVHPKLEYAFDELGPRIIWCGGFAAPVLAEVAPEELAVREARPPSGALDVAALGARAHPGLRPWRRAEGLSTGIPS